MKPLTVSTLPFYMKSSVASAVTTLPRIANRYASALGPLKDTAKVDLPKSWLPVILENKHIHSLFDSATIKDVCSRVKSGLNGSDLGRVFYAMVTLELLLTAIPNVRHDVEFSAAPEIPG